MSKDCKNCKCGGSCSTREPKIGEDLPRDPYESLYERCKCGKLGLFPEHWDYFGKTILRSDGLHARKGAEFDCKPLADLSYPSEAATCKQLGGTWP